MRATSKAGLAVAFQRTPEGNLGIGQSLLRQADGVYDAAMDSGQRQFGIFALFVLTTAAAIAFAIIRLPVPLELKVCAVPMVAICFMGWALRNWKYPDPRKPVPISQSYRRLAFLPQLLTSLWILVWGYAQVYSSGLIYSPLGCLFVVFLVLIAGVNVWNIVRHWNAQNQL